MRKVERQKSLTLSANGGDVPVMDPIETFKLMMLAMEEKSHEEAFEHGTNLKSWIERGGFPPLLRVTSDDKRHFLATDELAKAFCLAACDIVIVRGCEPFSPKPR